MSSPAQSNRPSAYAISDALTDLALDLRWSFNHSADQLWERLDPELWDLTHNPWVVLQTVSRERLAERSPPIRNFKSCWPTLNSDRKAAERTEGWFQKAHPQFGSHRGCLFLHGVHAERGACRFIRAASATWPAINSKRQAIWAFR